ncbi:ABC transporter substrate binding protein [Vibrio sp. Hep-1b-8]|uniref:ABC transporter substrate-binding protein n=1 Tax=Vibrio sp. Hep-1b-8 TaxID=2144187 RepID=UPI0011103E31|nr:ABC transporter substrate binding protein [Vibrio sp. Hep-1b-8]TMX36775.1 ABC transporter substrate-binding protein [Vibrio sp. Hep-1b-8]
MRRALLIITLLLVSVMTSSQVYAQETKQVVMLLWRGVTDAEKGFMEYLSSQRDVTYTLLDAKRDEQTLASYVANIDSYHADLIYTFGTTTTLALLGTEDKPSAFRQANQTPVVFSIVSDPVGSKIVSDTTESPRNFTGVSHIVPHQVQFNAIQKLPNINTMGIIFNPLENNAVITARKIQMLSAQFCMDVYLYPLRTKQGKPDSASLPIVIEAMKQDHVQLAYLPPDSYIISQGQYIVESLHNQGIATFSATETPIRKHNALFGIVSRYYNVGEFAGHKAEQILSKNSTAQALPIEPLSQYSYIVNVNAARTLDYYPPVSILKISELIGGNE